MPVAVRGNLHIPARQLPFKLGGIETQLFPHLPAGKGLAADTDLADAVARRSRNDLAAG
ncbi:hypothetical protein D3C86_2059350 [compost metagenome]